MNNYIRGWGKSWESSRNTLDSIVKSAPLVKLLYFMEHLIPQSN